MNRHLTTKPSKWAFLGLFGLALPLGCQQWDLPVLPDTLADGLVTQYSFDGVNPNGSAAELRGTLVKGAAYGTGRDGVPNAALLLDGIDDYFEIPDHVNLRSGVISISLWIKPQRVPGSSHLFYKANFTNALNYQYGCKMKPRTPGVASDGYLFESEVKREGTCDQAGSAALASAAEPTLPLNQWHHVVSVYDGQTVQFYLNGTRRAQSETRSLPILNCPGSTLRFGAAWDGDINAFDGLMDDIRIYNRALTEAEVKLLHRR